MNSFLKRLKEYTRNPCKLQPNQPILVGVSGGADSLCLLDSLHRLKFPVIVAHFNHQLREDAHDDTTFVAEIATHLGVPFVAGTGDVTGFSHQEGLSIEEGARTLRYRFLFEQAYRYRAQAVAVGHTADDQAETVLMHFLRGAGLDGLKGMLPRTILSAWSEEIPVVRPLLEMNREEVLAYCRESDFHPRFDQSNLDQAFFRNRLRHELIPILETYNPRFREAVNRTAKTLAADLDALQQITLDAWEDCILRTAPAYLSLSVIAFLLHPVGIRRRVLRKGIENLRPGLRDVDLSAIERAIEFVEAEKEGTCELTGNLRLFAEGLCFWLAEKESDLPFDEWPQLIDQFPRLLEVPGAILLNDGWQLTAARAARREGHDRRDRIWLHLGDLTAPLLVRTRLPGDRFQPFGMKGKTVKLSDFLINAKIPRRARDSWPLVCVDDQIAWIPGVRTAEAFRAGEEGGEVIELRVEQIA